jgi:hypothetical protein
VPAAGRHAGIGMVSRRLHKLRRDFPGWRHCLYFPTLLWVNDSDAMLRGLTWLGWIAAAFVIYGGPLGFWALLICYVCYLSLDVAIALIFPWDSLLYEATLLALFLPSTLPLPQLAAAAAPAPALTWAYRLLLFRVMFGFGKQKFLGSRKEDLAYLKGFLTNQPLLSPVAWYAQKLPVALLKPAVFFMFLVEIPIPFLAFVPGWPSVLCAATTAALMVGIQLMGSFGYFSLMTICCCIPLLDNITPQTLSWAHLFGAGAPNFTDAYVLVHTLSTLVVFPFSSWIGQSWMLWAAWYQLPRWVLAPLGFLQHMHPFRWLHPYGVFPPNNQPSAKITLMLEVSWDRKQWHEVEFVYAPTNVNSAPHFVAPHHPRGDQAVIYDTFGLNPSSLISAMLGPFDPNLFAARLPAVAFCQSVLDGTALPMTRPGPLQQHSQRPVAARLTTVMLEPVSLAEHERSGAYWKRTYIGPHTPARELDPEFWSDCLGEPELWHFEAIMWRRRSTLRPLIDRAQKEASPDPMQLVLYDGELSPNEVQRFWNDFMPLISGDHRRDLSTLPAVVDAVKHKFSRSERRALYRLLNRFALILVARLEPLYLHHGAKPEIPVRTYFHLWMLAHHIMSTSRDAYVAAVANPRAVIDHIPNMTNHTGLFALGVFRYEEFVFESQKLRLIEAFQHPHDPAKKRATAEIVRSENFESLPKVEQFFVRFGQRVSGFFNISMTLRDHFVGPQYDQGYPELYPVFRELESGEVVTAAYGTIGDRPIAPDLKSLPPQPETAESAAQ